VLFAWRMC